MTNALKYAFPRGGPGEISILLRKVGDGRCELSVSDDGIGLPEGCESPKSGSPGLTLVRLLTAPSLPARWRSSGQRELASESGFLDPRCRPQPDVRRPHSALVTLFVRGGAIHPRKTRGIVASPWRAAEPASDTPSSRPDRRGIPATPRSRWRWDGPGQR
jgi:hypothetical protein